MGKSALALGLLLAGCGAGGSPAATFETAKKASSEGDWRSFFNCIVPEQRDELLAGVALLCAFSGVGKDDAAQKQILDQLNAVVRKHGAAPLPAEGSWPKPQEMFLRVTDKGGLFADLMTLSAKLPGTNEIAIGADAVLKDLKIEGDRATARMSARNGKDQDVTFVRHEGRWYLSAK